MTTKTTRTAAASSSNRDLAAEISFLTRALKAPTMREAVPRLAERARTESWTHEEFLVACLQREVSARESHGGEGRIRAARFPSRKSLEGSTSTTPADSNVIWSRTWAPWTSSPPKTTWSSSGRPALARRTWRSGWRSGRVRLGTACCSPPPANGWHGWPTLITPAASSRNSSAWAATRCWLWTKLATSVRARSGQPVLPAGVFPLRAGQPDRHLQQAVRALG